MQALLLKLLGNTSLGMKYRNYINGVEILTDEQYAEITITKTIIL